MTKQYFSKDLDPDWKSLLYKKEFIKRAQLGVEMKIAGS